MKRTFWLTAVFCIFSLVPLLALSCRNCGAHLPDGSRFCNSCGAVQNSNSPAPIKKTGATASATQRPIAGEEITNQQFMKLFAPLEAFEPELRISRLNSPQVRSTIQLTLIPGLEKLKEKMNQRNLRFSKPQTKLLALFRERCATILKWSSTLGMERNIVADRVSQLACLQEYLRVYLDDETLAAIEVLEEVYSKELENMKERIDNMNESAGFENPGAAYQIRQKDLAEPTDQFTFSLLMASSGKKIGNHMQVFDHSHKLLGQLNLVHEEKGIRNFSGKISRKAFEAMDSRQVWIEYAVRTKFSTSWQNQKLRLYLVPCQKRDDPAGYEYEALHGTNPEIVRVRFLQGIGIF
ncbi:MAG: zinc ribbon domain-containing protein [Candidatus Riflebacteria bacterium]|nr:zinc ribbon domain-containing protein [Candidatus Riflebacteria bacterium]